MVRINCANVAFFIGNLILLLSGICLVTLGCIVLNDSPRVLLSGLFLEPGFLSRPLLYYIALGFIIAGLVVFLVALMGFWALCDTESVLLMGCYMVLLISLLVAEVSIGSVAALCPRIIGMTADRDQMVANLMNNYGIPGRSQYTAAVDLAQTLLKCCGMQSGSDYDGSKWWVREQESRHDLRVPHSCCFLENVNEENSFLNPKPINSSLCQAKTNSRYQYGRHVKGCVDKLNEWFKEHVTMFLVIGLSLIFIQLIVFLCALLLSLKRNYNPERPSLPLETLPEQETISSEKKYKRSEKNPTPRSERKKGSIQVHSVEENGFVVGKSNQSSVEVQKNAFKTMDYPPKKLNSGRSKDSARNSEGFSRAVDSPSLPLVLRNEHFQRFNDCGSKRTLGTLTRKDSVVMAKCKAYRSEESDVYFTPHNDSGEQNISFRMRCNYDINDDDEDYYYNNQKHKENLKSYFCRVNEKYGLDNDTYESFHDT